MSVETVSGASGRRDAWRGVAAEDADDVSSDVSNLLRRRSRRLLGMLLAPYRGPLVLATVLILIRTAGQLSISLLVGIAIDRGIRVHDVRALWLYTGALLVAVVAAAAGQFLFLRVSGEVGQSVLYDLRMHVFRHIQDLSLSFYERYTSGRVIARQTSDMDAISELLATGLTSIVTSVVSVVAIAVILLKLDFRLGAVILLSFPLVVVLTQWFRMNSERSYRAVRQAVALVTVHYTESLWGIRAVHAYGREPRNQEIFVDVNGRYRDANAWSTRLSATFGPGLKLLGRVTTAGVLVFGGVLVIHSSLTLGVLTAFILYVRQFFEPMQELSQFYNLFQAAAAAMEKLSGVIEEEPSVPPAADPVRPDAVDSEVRFDEVTFAYLDEAVLHDVSLVIPPGQVVALVGKTGAGKSTMARLMARFFDPTEGRVLLDGVDLRQLDDRSLRRAVVVVTQESFLFAGTVAGNIRFGRPEARTLRSRPRPRRWGPTGSSVPFRMVNRRR